jgi:uncharacterized protein (DUF1015 family)
VAEVLPFKGIRYNQTIVKDIGAVMCPPHDVIPPQLQDELYRRSEHNFIRVEFGREFPQDSPADNRYTRSAAIMKQWFDLKVLKPEDASAIYVHDYQFARSGKNYRRRVILARVRLEEWSKRIIFPHEGTLSKSKNDRLGILWSCKANTSPILAMFQDPDRQITGLIDRETSRKSIIDTKTPEGEKHVVWSITKTEALDALTAAFASRPLYIADGHHRYESALLFKHEREAAGRSTGDEGYNFVMMALVEFNDPGLLILPPHRLIRGVSRQSLLQLKSELSSFFNVTEFSLTDKHLWQKVDSLLTGGIEHVRMGLFGPGTEHLYILELKDNTPAAGMMPVFHTDIYKRLDVSIVDHVILEKLLGVKADSETALTYTYEKQDAIDRVKDGEFQLAVLLNPVKAEVIKAIADAGDRMPRKSTYFFPKEPAGLVFNKLE